MHHETSGAVTDYERQLDTAIRFMIQYGYPGIKGGYVGKIIPRGEHHDGQWMVDHYERLASKFGLNKMTMDLHEPVRPTGLHRTYHTTLAKQLALYVTMYSPIQMAADLIENYEKRPDAFKFIKEVPTDWDTTVVLDAEPGDYIYMARRERNGKQWFVGAITDEQERLLSRTSAFLLPERNIPRLFKEMETALIGKGIL
ncbi:MAG: glycoside hydrolase family 97 catalytic domain-containing protein [Saprospiraceae bacterium]|nr:glycoside hydrolase family 97 catalytic domain-containing protein [Candidatus Vicinibacter affinis]